jgi:hypothetical protein
VIATESLNTLLLADVKSADSGVDMYVTDPAHGGKVTCHKCGGFIDEVDVETLIDTSKDQPPLAYFHKKCFNRYEHYYGLDKPLD